MPNNLIKNTRIVLIYPCEIIRASLDLLLRDFGFCQVYSFENYESLASKPESTKAELAIIHHSVCSFDGSIGQIRNLTGAKVALIASSDTFQKDNYPSLKRCILEGATGFLDMNEPRTTFLSALEDIIYGDVVISKRFATNLMQALSVVSEKPDEELSDRETQVLKMVAGGSTNKEISHELFISEHTVKGHLSNIFSKLKLKNRQQAAAYLIKKQFMDKEDENGDDRATG